jgi:hypothetical protein
MAAIPFFSEFLFSETSPERHKPISIAQYPSITDPARHYTKLAECIQRKEEGEELRVYVFRKFCTGPFYIHSDFKKWRGTENKK